MKTQLQFLLSVAFVFITTLGFAQVTATQAGIAVQGIARDDNNTVRAGSSIMLYVALVETDDATNVIKSNEITTTTDAFGVFSFVFNVSASDYATVANTGLNLVIRNGSMNGAIISNEPINFVPYAIAAANGVPTGSIMPFMGTTAPAGWVICDGRDIPDVDGAGKQLQTLLGGSSITRVPDLRGMFLRGAGQHGNATHAANIEPNTLANIQEDEIQQHAHHMDTNDVGLTIEGNGEHNHTLPRGSGGNGDYFDTATSGGAPNGVRSHTDSVGDHSHRLFGWTQNWPESNTGASENRPINYGVNYIIKL